MLTPMASDQALAMTFTASPMIGERHLQCCVDCLGAGSCKEDVVKSLRCDLPQSICVVKRERMAERDYPRSPRMTQLIPANFAPSLVVTMLWALDAARSALNSRRFVALVPSLAIPISMFVSERIRPPRADIWRPRSPQAEAAFICSSRLSGPCDLSSAHASAPLRPLHPDPRR